VRAHQPMRTCVGCGAQAPQNTLRRFIAGSDGLRIDGPRRAPGRGAYLHADPDCWRAFARRRGPVRSLRLNPPPAERERLIGMLVAGPAAGAER
jgi:uncharacterized protein